MSSDLEQFESRFRTVRKDKPPMPNDIDADIAVRACRTCRWWACDDRQSESLDNTNTCNAIGHMRWMKAGLSLGRNQALITIINSSRNHDSIEPTIHAQLDTGPDFCCSLFAALAALAEEGAGDAR